MATVSRQSAFWAVVALGLNTFTQDGGKVLGFPAEYSRALRLSPIVCIVDTLGVLFSVAFFSYRTRSFRNGLTLAARYRGLTEEERAEPRLERTWWFRLVLFCPLALSQVLKILGMSGIPITKTWGMAYLVSFLIIEGLELAQPAQHGDYHALEPYAAVMDKHVRWHGFLAVLTQHCCLLVQLLLIPLRLHSECDVERGRVRNALVIVGLVACYALVVPTLLIAAYLVSKRFTFRAPFLGVVMEVTQIMLWSMACSCPLSLIVVSYTGEPRCAFSPVLVQILAISLLLTSIMLPFLLDDVAYENQWFRQTPFLIRRFRELFGLKRSERGNHNFFLLFAALSVESIMYYYLYIYNPSKTYKPPWTEYLG